MWNSRQIKWNIALGRLPPAVHSKNRLPGAALTSHVQEFIPAALSPLSPPPLSLSHPHSSCPESRRGAQQHCCLFERLHSQHQRTRQEDEAASVQDAVLHCSGKDFM